MEKSSPALKSLIRSVCLTILYVDLVMASLGDEQYQISSCLTLHNINNFTTLPSTSTTCPNESYYYKMLNFSIQNLRFADPSIPKPVAIILPQSVEQIISAVSCARKASCKITVRSGGHSYEGTSTSITASATAIAPPFVIIDLMNLNRVTVDLESETAWVEGGATLGETYYAIFNASSTLDLDHNYGFSAGSCPTVGVGGHISGGGFGLLSRKYGVAADNVVDALLVDANGQLLDRESMGEEVFWAIRGGGGGVWGIIYAWKVRLLKVPPTVTAFIVSRPGTITHVAKLVDKWQAVAPNLGDDFYLSCFVGAGLPETATTGISATFKGFYVGTKTNTVSLIHRVFPELGVVEQDCFEMSWIQSTVFFSGLAPGSSVSDLRNRYKLDKAYFKAKSDYVRTPISHAGIRAALHILEEEPKGHVILDPYGGIMDRISTESIAFPHRKGNLYSIQYMVEWHQQDNDKREDYINWIKTLYNAMAPYVSWGPRASYVNYMDFDLGMMVTDQLVLNASFPANNEAVEIARVWGEKYFLNNFDRLVRAKTLIDPRNVFTNQQGIPPISNLLSLSA
ncbi:Xanthine dehydrogenase C subunit [Parasponia andersonii]|uniref:Xanthine dehydrogenase C subunit n=1 Tax=Parasponia andersonii TaxID=3476 RepID=A0A2P5CHK5_PARAD|nr:Xanthine dehydrogenase C subunit [Parasponia andersonii]